VITELKGLGFQDNDQLYSTASTMRII